MFKLSQILCLFVITNTSVINVKCVSQLARHESARNAMRNDWIPKNRYNSERVGVPGDSTLQALTALTAAVMDRKFDYSALTNKRSIENNRTNIIAGPSAAATSELQAESTAATVRSTLRPSANDIELNGHKNVMRKIDYNYLKLRFEQLIARQFLPFILDYVFGRGAFEHIYFDFITVKPLFQNQMNLRKHFPLLLPLRI